MLYLSDLDFTLLRSDLTLSDFTKRVWNKAANKEKLSVATARSLTGVRELLKGLELKEPLILLDGAIIATIDGKILHSAVLNKELGNEIIKLAKSEVGLEPLIVAQGDEAEEFIYPKNLNKYQKELLETMKNRNRIFTAQDFYAKDKNIKMVFMGDEKPTAHLEKALKAKFGDAIEIKRSKDPYMDCYFMTILDPKGDKAHALAKLEEIEDVSIENTTVFGDSYNDIGMFKLAKTKVAVANAVDELKKLATIVLKESNDEDAVAKYLARDLYIKVL